MSWTTLSTDDIKGRLTGAEFTALTTVARSSGQSADDIIAQALDDTTRRVRGYVAACAHNTLGETGTIPDELKSAALALVREFFFTRLPGMKSLNDETRQKELERAVQELRDTAKCQFAIVPPETAAADQAAGTAITEVNSRTRVATREKLDGLM